MVQFEGDKDFPLEPGPLWQKLRDANFLVECIPDASFNGKPERDRAACSIHPGFSFVRGSLDVTLRIIEAQEPESIKILIVSKGIGSSSEVEAQLQFLPLLSGTRIHWQVVLKNLGGLLKMIPPGLIRGAAQKVIDDVWACAVEKVKL